MPSKVEALANSTRDILINLSNCQPSIGGSVEVQAKESATKRLTPRTHPWLSRRESEKWRPYRQSSSSLLPGLMHSRSRYLARLVLGGEPATDQPGDVVSRNLKNKSASTVFWVPVYLRKRFVVLCVLVRWRHISFLCLLAPKFRAVMGYESRFLQTSDSCQYGLL